MRALILKEHDTEEDLKTEIRYTKDGRYQLRLRAILLAKTGVLAKDIQKELMISSSTYCSWIKKYNNNVVSKQT